SFWDYGPLGVEMLNNIKQAWWRDTVYKRDDMEGLDAAILMSRKVWQHSGHEATFSDPLVDNRKTGKRYRLDHLLEAQTHEVRAALYESTGTTDLAGLLHALQGKAEDVPMLFHAARVADPSGDVGEWTEPRRFNLMF